MSKQQEAKARQGYLRRARMCGSCQHFRQDTETVRGVYGPYNKKHTNLRCTLGGFKVMAFGACNRWEGQT